MRFGKKQFSSGMTLLELLVVIAIIAILAAMLLPGLTRAKGAALCAACKSNLRQVSVSLRMYTDESQAYPAWLDRSYWDGKLLPAVGNNRRLFICPGVKPTPVWTNLAGLPMVNPCYCYNVCGTGRCKAPGPSLGLDSGLPATVVKESQVRVPCDMVSLACWTPWWVTSGDGDDAVNDNDGDESPFLNGNLLSALSPPRHNLGANVAFCDAHVEFGKLAAWSKRTDTARRRWNIDNQPHPETWGNNP